MRPLRILQSLALAATLAACSVRNVGDVSPREIHERTLAMALGGQATDFSILAEHREIVVSRRNLAAVKLPVLEGHDVILLSPAQIQARADQVGRFQYLELTPVQVADKVAKVAALTNWSIPSSTPGPVILMSGGAAFFEFRVGWFNRLCGKRTGGVIS